MRTIAIARYGSPGAAFEFRDLPAPEPQPGQVLIKVDAFGLNFADVMARKGLYQEAPKPPFVPGYEVVGRIEKLGAGTTDFTVGQCVVAFTRFGGYAEYACTPATAVVDIPENMSHVVAAALATQYCTAYHAACEATNLFPGERVLVHAAAGGVGTALVQLSKLKGCEVFGTAGSNEKLDYLKRIGVDHPINYRTSDFVDVVRKQLHGEPLDVVFDSLGGKNYRRSKSLLGPGGRIVSYGVAESIGKGSGTWNMLKAVLNFGFTHPVSLIMKSQAAIGVNMLQIADHKPEVLQRCLQNVVQLAKDGKLAPQSGAVFRADQIAEAHALLEGRISVGKIVMEW
jgi:NADPH:quinone reductase-like Zn-dependent oxidoreductase